MTDDLVTWLREQIATVERFASAAQAPYSGDRWEVIGGKRVVVRRWPSEFRVADMPILKAKTANIYLLHHVAMHDPAVVLAQCQAHLWMIAEIEHARETDTCGSERLLRLLALAYRHRDGYREEWRPEG
jgi:hypothetical protein